ncbi:hypothetical protein [Hymenobacter sp. UYCo722]|uniref:hypothetical protein n=1 Tax=Hymenobacter sp. UYCo722 TaxID=3156335 RepID=UPI003392E9B3
MVCAVVTLTAGFAAAVLRQTSPEEIRQLDRIFPYYHWHVQEISSPRLLAGASSLGLLSAVACLLFLLLLFGPRAKRDKNTWWGEYPRATTGWNTLTQFQRRLATVVILAITTVRLVQSIPAITPAYDDAASYALFVSRGLLAVTSYYPLPNNHVLSNLVDWLFFQVNPGFWWTMRLPVVLAATLATGLLFGGLLRARVPFRPSLLTVVLFSLSQLSLYHATVGRGYWLLMIGAALVFFATLDLSGPSPARARRAWLALIFGGIIGTYAVPTFAMMLVSAFSWLGLQAVRRQDWRQLLQTAISGGIISAGTLLVYAPLMLISGADKLFGNGFVAPRPWHEFLAGLPRYLWETEGFLAGQVKLGALITIVVLLGTAWYLRQAHQTAAAGILTAVWLRLGVISLWFIGIPYLLLVTQRVFAPGRTLFYKSFFLYLLLALLVEEVWDTTKLRQAKQLTLLAVAIGWTAYQFRSLSRDNQTPRQHNAAYHDAYAWLARHEPGPTLVPEPTHGIFLTLYFHSESPGVLWRPDFEPLPGRAYKYVVAFPNERGYFQPRFTYAPDFKNAEVEIYRVRESQPGPGLPAYWHLAN